MKRLLLSLFALFTALILIIPSPSAFAGAKEDIDRQLAAIQQQEDAAAKDRQQADQLAADLKAQKSQEVVTMNQLLANIEEQGKKLDDLNKQIDTATTTVKETGQQLADAEDRVATRDELLKTRLRLMYQNGSVSYLDVLFSATSFSDFLDRYNMLKTIVGQDKKILEENKKDRDLVVEKKKQVEDELAQVKTLYAQAQTVKQSLQQQEKQKEVVIASLSKQQEEAENHSDEQENNLIALAKQKAALFQQKTAILAEEKRQEDLKRQQELQRQQELERQKAAQTKKPVAPVNISRTSGGKLGWPLPTSNTITSPFGYRIDPIAHTNKLHKGVDIGAPNGSTIVAADDGVVLIASWVNGYGNTVVIDHGNGLWTWYGHIREGGIKVSEGDTVKRGQKIAEVGSTGDSTGNHLHFEVRINEQPVDPMPYLR